jgi:uncharacterized phage protein (TIGR01671 family)
MTRELKFRQFLNGKFHYWGYDELGFSSPLTGASAQGLESEQYTGLRDCKGKMIYEGDICKDIKGDYLKIKFDKDNAVFCGEVVKETFQAADRNYSLIGKTTLLSQRLELLGNIHEDPELCKEN